MSSIEDILQVTSDVQDKRGYSLLQSEDFVSGPLQVSDVDAVLLYQLIENETLKEPFDYLNGCFQRCQQQKRLNKNGNTYLMTMFQEIDRLVIGYGLVALQVEGFSPNGDFMSYIKQIVSNVERYLDYLSHLIQRAIVEGTLAELLEGFFPTLLRFLTQELQYFDLNDSALYHSVLTLFEMFVNFKPAAAIFSQITGFFANYDCKPNQFEKTTLLGPILTLSPLNPNVALRNYGENLERSQQQKNMIHESLQTEHKVVIERLFFIIDKIVRGSPTSRADVMSYFAMIVNKNHLRRGEHAQQNKLASNAFMTNISLILIKFSEPFLDISYKRIDKIDVNYFNNLNLFIDLSGETRVNSDFKEADEFHDKNKRDGDCKPNFISDCFFLTMTYLHYGIGGTLLYDEKITPQIKRLKQEIDRIKKISQSQDMFATFASVHLKQMEKSLKTTQSIKDSLQGFFSHRNLQLEVFDFICGASVFLMRAIDPEHVFPSKYFSLPLIPDQVGVENVDNADFLRAHAPVPFKYYPEFVIEGPINYSLYISQYNTSPIFRNPRLASFVELATAILRCPELVSNPHLKGKLVQLLSVGAMPLTDDSPGFMMDVFENDTFVSDHLLYAFLDFYVIVEKTGSSSQFYDKFNSRYSISIILEQFYYRIPKYKEQLIWQAKHNADFFVRFVARMLNDLTFLLDEGLGNLAEVHNINIELENRSKGLPSKREEDENELRSKLISAERQAKSSCGLAGKSITLFELYTKDIPNAFVTPEIVDRLASMLDHNLESLVGPKCGELKVKDPQKYSFNPKQLLKTLTTVYIHLSDEPSFVSAVARDGRSFRKELFERAVHILAMKIGLVSDDFCHKLLQFSQKAEEQKAAEEAEDMGYGEIPDEFLDPLMFTIMSDPVILPASRMSIDRSTIKAHLLSDSTDPFNRMPLKLEQVIPNDELRHQIEEFKRQKKGNNV
ncbi:probable E4 ubiquitin-protein ligase UFD2 [Zygosaccharomyces bailii ISA1307]|nr:probable E4 ubiquitin-protein ligase UFD2 [Zygosaccharomyces bailii ISA1307]